MTELWFTLTLTLSHRGRGDFCGRVELLRPAERLHAGLDGFDDSVNIEDAAAPCAAGGVLEGGPQTGVVGKAGVRFEVVGVGSAVQLGVAPVRAEVVAVFADQVYRALQGVAVYDDFYDIALPDLAYWASGERLGAYVSDAGAGGDAGEAGVGDERDVLAVGQVA